MQTSCHCNDVAQPHGVSQPHAHKHQGEPHVSTRRQGYELSPCLLSTVLAHRDGEELICSYWSFLVMSELIPVEEMDPVRSVAG